MFCSQCGTNNNNDVRFCTECGKQVMQNNTREITPPRKSYKNVEDLTPELRAKLRGYETHTNMSCLECGYSGLMGVTGKIVPWYLSYWLWIPIYIIIALTGAKFVGSFIVGLIVGITRNKLLKKKALCPACDTHITSINNI